MRHPSPSPRRSATTPLAVALSALLIGALLAGAALAGPSSSRPVDHSLSAAAEQAAPGGAKLRSFDSCGHLRGYARRHRAALPGNVFALEEDAVARAEGEAAAPSAGTTGYSPTNVQEQGVDEPDLVKTDGSHIFSISGERLEAVQLDATGAPETIGSLLLPKGPGDGTYTWGHELLLAGERAVVISNADMGSAPWTRTILTEVDLSDPTAMRAVSTLTVDSAYVSARLSGSTARVVTATTPTYPTPSAGPESGARPAWMPMARLRDRSEHTLARSPLMPCRDVRKPARFSGLEMLSVLTIDLEQGLDPVDTDAVMTGGEVVYASEQALYVATERWLDPEDPDARISQVSTAIHKFDVTDPGTTDYRASGRVPGYMLSQWSMSEQEGLLRVASTLTPPWESGDVGTAAESESLVTVLGEGSERLVEVGQVGGLGEGEQIYAVRFSGDVGYVVTFRQVDPLYTLDLSDAADPRVLGELKVPGYSAYLHPAGTGSLLGIGQDANNDGLTLGAQISLYDVTDLTAPGRIDRHSLGPESYTEVEYDHHAFLYWEPTELAVVPVEIYGGQSRHYLGAVALRVDPATGIERLRRLSHGDGWRSAIRRSFVVGEQLLTVSERGVMAHDLDTLEVLGWAGFER